mmetsp:Transcript_20111/g.40614  ORF Transcript_20111/g.40614 Transcript_20111/m.40614 type:complete len:352 (+) Transcript_20111:124-1179(+)|eukprot:CAMPEP_0167788862 /NCGR_PEP_ID=MMETSP0111_2-20121227/10305_1 /TAXON_ID=91324 /ORGANISM="Lotharella globosa, Strain CCCM811" /LENGTH=351 /DNA_ID=CAMNT_0007680845 /DNA_START=111 /DNA_END=1166 /DNA_ORIENTATION=+
MSERDNLKKQIHKLEQELEMMRKDRGTQNWLEQESKDRFDGITAMIKCQKVLKGHFGKIYAMHWAQGQNSGQMESRLVSASQDGKLIIWNAFTQHKTQAIMLRSSWVMTCAFSPDKKRVACGGLDNLCSIYDVEDSKEPLEQMKKPPELREHDGYLSCCRFVDNGRIITTSGDGNCILWDVNELKAISHFKNHTADVMSVSIQKNGDQFVTGSCDQSAKVWDHRTGKCVMDFQGCHDSDINSVAFFPDGLAFGTGSDNSRARLLDLRSCRQLQEYHDATKFCCVTSVDFSSTGKLLFAGYDDYNVQVWNVANGRKSEQLDGHDNRVSCLGVSSDGKALCTGSWDTFLRVWA